MLESSFWNFYIDSTSVKERVPVFQWIVENLYKICDFNFAFAEFLLKLEENCIQPNNVQSRKCDAFLSNPYILYIGIGDTWNWMRNISSGVQERVQLIQRTGSRTIYLALCHTLNMYINVQITPKPTGPLSNVIYYSYLYLTYQW